MNKKHFFAAVMLLSLLAVGLHIALAEGLLPQIDIDIKPSSEDNVINIGANGVIPVAILSEPGFDATDENVVIRENIFLEGLTVGVRGNGVAMAQERDVDGDGDVDLVVQIEIENLDPGLFQDGEARLWIANPAGNWGVDSVTIVPPE